MMKIKILLSIAAFAFSMGAFSQGIEFEHGTFDEALAKAKAENKMLFMDCYTAWCGPCKHMANTVFPLKEVGDYFNAHFVNLKMDMEKGEGPELLEKYGVKAFPTLLWIDAEGKVIHRIVGGKTTEALLEEAKIARNPEKNWGSMERRFKNGERSIAFLQDYILMAFSKKIDTKEAVEIYYSKRSNDELLNVKDAEIIFVTVKSASDDKFHSLLKNKDRFYQLTDTAKVDGFIENTMQSEMKLAQKSGDKAVFEKIKKEIFAMDEVAANKAFSTFMMMNSNNLLMKLSDFALKNNFDNSRTLSHSVIRILEAAVVTEIEEALWEKALKMAEHLVELNPDYKNTDIYARVLYKVGKVGKAKKMAKQLVELAPEDEKKDLWSFKFLNGEF